MSLRFIPSSNDTRPSSVASTSYGAGAPSVEAIPDTLRNGGHVPIAEQINGKHPLQNRLEKWEETQTEFKMESYRRLYGAGEPIRRTMEMKIVDHQDKTLPNLTGERWNVHRDVLHGKETSVDWEDVYNDATPMVDVHTAMGKQMGL